MHTLSTYLAIVHPFLTVAKCHMTDALRLAGHSMGFRLAYGSVQRYHRRRSPDSYHVESDSKTASDFSPQLDYCISQRIHAYDCVIDLCPSRLLFRA